MNMKILGQDQGVEVTMGIEVEDHLARMLGARFQEVGVEIEKVERDQKVMKGGYIQDPKARIGEDLRA